MKRRTIYLAAAALVLAALGFYGVWPALSALAIKTALENRDPAALESRIEFDSVRNSLRPALTAKVAEGYDRYQQKLGTTGSLIMGQVKNDAVPKLVDISLRALVTPAFMIRVVNDARPLKEAIERILNEHLGKTIEGESSGGGILGRVLRRDPPRPAAPDAGPAPDNLAPPQPGRKFSLANVKSLGFAGPLAFTLGVAKDPSATDADFTAEMRFTRGTWKLTGVTPRF